MSAIHSVLLSSEQPGTDSRRGGHSEPSPLNPHLSADRFLPSLDSEPGAGRARSAEMTGGEAMTHVYVVGINVVGVRVSQHWMQLHSVPII